MAAGNGVHAELVARLCELMSPEDVRAAAPEMSIADLRRCIDGCEAQEARWAALGFVDAAADQERALRDERGGG